MQEHAQIAAALPQYDIAGELGRGAWGLVIRAVHRQLGREVAIKQLPSAFASDPAVRRRFLTEARLLATLDHPHIVPIFDYVEQEGLCLLVMELLSGGTLWERFTTSGLTMEGACSVALATASALGFAHDRGIFHRDVKPENLLFTATDIVKVSDFGIAKIAGGNATMATVKGEVLGTPAYMSPEQAMGRQLTAATDMYALGTVLFELLSGRLPFDDDGNALALLHCHVYEEPFQLRDLAPDVPAGLSDVVMKCLAKDPKDRYQTAEDFGIAIADATTAVWGPRWNSRTGLPVMASEAVAARLSEPRPRTVSKRASAPPLTGKPDPGPASPPEPVVGGAEHRQRRVGPSGGTDEHSSVPLPSTPSAVVPLASLVDTSKSPIRSSADPTVELPAPPELPVPGPSPEPQSPGRAPGPEAEPRVSLPPSDRQTPGPTPEPAPGPKREPRNWAPSPVPSAPGPSPEPQTPGPAPVPSVAGPSKKPQISGPPQAVSPPPKARAPEPRTSGPAPGPGPGPDPPASALSQPRAPQPWLQPDDLAAAVEPVTRTPRATGADSGAGTPPRLPGASRRRRVAVLAGVAVVLAAGVGVAAVTLSGGKSTGGSTSSTDVNTAPPTTDARGAVGTPIAVGVKPNAIAITPNGATAYVVNFGDDTVMPITVANGATGAAIHVGKGPAAIAFTPDGTKAYVANFGDVTVTPIVLETSTPGSPIHVGTHPSAIAITPGGSTAYVTNSNDNTVVPIILDTGAVGAPIKVGNDPTAIAITPNGDQAYVTNFKDGTVTPITLATGSPGAPIKVGSQPSSIAIAPNGAIAAVTNFGDATVTPITLATGAPGAPIHVGNQPVAIAVSPDGAMAYVADSKDNTVTPIEVASGAPGAPIALGKGPDSIAITSDGVTAYVANFYDNTVTPLKL